MQEKAGMGRRLKVFFDGGCHPNPGPMEAAVVIRGTPHFFDDLGTGSNTDAEWQALLCAIALARDLGLDNVAFIGDSREVIDEASLAAAGRQANSGHAAALAALLAHYRPGRIRWIKREQNLAGIALAARRGR
ncbi:MAG: ribonuclease HI [Erythrobacter sp.]|jgi:ribonuclease HI